MILTVTLNAAIDKRYVVDDFKVGEVNRVRECTYVPGGKGLNVSKPASIYGAEVVATGFVGGDQGFLCHLCFANMRKERRRTVFAGNNQRGVVLTLKGQHLIAGSTVLVRCENRRHGKGERFGCRLCSRGLVRPTAAKAKQCKPKGGKQYDKQSFFFHKSRSFTVRFLLV